MLYLPFLIKVLQTNEYLIEANESIHNLFIAAPLKALRSLNLQLDLYPLPIVYLS